MCEKYNFLQNTTQLIENVGGSSVFLVGAQQCPTLLFWGRLRVLFLIIPLLALALLLQQRQVLLLLAPLTLVDALELHREYVSGDALELHREYVSGGG
jgi:hypothetical protein